MLSPPRPFDAAKFPPASDARLSLQRELAGDLRPVVIASMSRSGSTMLYRKVVSRWLDIRFGPDGPELLPCFADAAWRLDQTPLIGGVVYKTHDLPENLPRSARAKVVFTYRKASDVALSIADKYANFGDPWFHSHRHHLGGSGGYEDFLRADTLGLERQIDRWSAAEGLDVLGLRFETLWDHQRELDEFLGFAVKLRQRRPSPRPPAPPALVERLGETYGALDRKIAAMPDVFRRCA